jgi:hypothetical protein
MEERQSVDLSQKLDRLLVYTRQLFPENDSKFVEGMIKKIVDRFHENEIGQELLIHLLESLPKTIGKYSDMMWKKHESKFKVGYLIKDAAKEAAEIELFKDIKDIGKEIYNKINEIKHIEDKLYNTFITIMDRLHEISVEPLKPNISDEERKKLSERWINNALLLYIEAKRSAYKANKTGIGYDLIDFTKKKLTYELFFRFHKSPEDAYNKGIEFAEKEIIPMFEEVVNVLTGVTDKYRSAIAYAKGLLEGKISDEWLKYIEEKIKNPAEYERLKRNLYLLFFVLIGSSLFLIGNKETMMTVFSVNIIPLSLILGVIIVLLFIYFFFNKAKKKILWEILWK